MISLSCFHLFFFFISKGLAAPVLNFLVSICGAAGAMLSGRSPPSLSLSEKNKMKKSHQNQTEKKHSRSFSFDLLGQHSGCRWLFQSVLPPCSPALGSSA